MCQHIENGLKQRKKGKKESNWKKGKHRKLKTFEKKKTHTLIQEIQRYARYNVWVLFFLFAQFSCIYLFKWLSKQINIFVHDFSLLRNLFSQFHTFEIKVLTHSLFLCTFLERQAICYFDAHEWKTEVWSLNSSCTCTVPALT